MGQNKSWDNADAILKMAVMRRGVDEEFYAVVTTGSHKEGDTFNNAHAVPNKPFTVPA